MKARVAMTAVGVVIGTAAVIVLIPVLIVFLAMQRFFVKGVVLSGMKE